ncbi:hypothetical protein Acr_26g0006760 [Actinidia rufa]|uniref:Uncharacterized protein n=1 Tax=Actinidia rufa TaxID=165716 RepID=A0A7J0H2U7_9ERIC|nr:hypothetical protein Acr_26g0006760 [Actinidia rufa]
MCKIQVHTQFQPNPSISLIFKLLNPQFSFKTALDLSRAPTGPEPGSILYFPDPVPADLRAVQEGGSVVLDGVGAGPLRQPPSLGPNPNPRRGALHILRRLRRHRPQEPRRPFHERRSRSPRPAPSTASGSPSRTSTPRCIAFSRSPRILHLGIIREASPLPRDRDRPLREEEGQVGPQMARWGEDTQWVNVNLVYSEPSEHDLCAFCINGKIKWIVNFVF